jgi:hypothetical protein
MHNLSLRPRRVDGGAARRRTALVNIAAAACCALAAGPVAAENWVGIAGSNLSGSLAVDADSVRPVAQYPDRLGMWLRYTYAMSIDCSPPRGCLAASQRVYALVNCPAQAIAYVQRISMDLNGNVVGQSPVDFDAVQYVVYPGTVEGELWRVVCPGYPDRFERR